jgi:hypothetical protein
MKTPNAVDGVHLDKPEKRNRSGLQTVLQFSKPDQESGEDDDGFDLAAMRLVELRLKQGLRVNPELAAQHTRWIARGRREG